MNSPHVTVKDAKAYARAHGYAGKQGGWIYTANGRPVCQGWESFAWAFRVAIDAWLRKEAS